jgi:hypothetical protein
MKDHLPRPVQGSRLEWRQFSESSSFRVRVGVTLRMPVAGFCAIPHSIFDVHQILFIEMHTALHSLDDIRALLFLLYRRGASKWWFIPSLGFNCWKERHTLNSNVSNTIHRRLYTRPEHNNTATRGYAPLDQVSSIKTMLSNPDQQQNRGSNLKLND